MSFSTFNLHPRVASGIPVTYTNPTPIQERAIPLILDGRDLLGLAQTGTGKTAAFALPILNRLLPQGSSARRRIRSLVIAPTRELATQIGDSFAQLGANTGLIVTTIFGGVSMNAQIYQLRKGVDIVVGCPGRLLDHITQRTIDLRSVEVLVLDEADQMFDMGFLPTVRKILASLPKERQSLLFSATMPPEIHRLATEILTRPEHIEIGQRAPVETVSHWIYPIDQQRKTDLLLHLLKDTGSQSIIVFTRTKHRAKRLGQTLEKEGYQATSLQGNLSQHKRQAALDGFRNGRYQILVATDIAARGLDIANVSHVINFDIPDTVDAYTHRIGRTGRAERTGDAFTFVTAEDEQLVRDIERVLKSRIERREVAGFVRSNNTASPGGRPHHHRQGRGAPHDRNRRQGQRHVRFGSSGALPARRTSARAPVAQRAQE